MENSQNSQNEDDEKKSELSSKEDATETPGGTFQNEGNADDPSDNPDSDSDSDSNSDSNSSDSDSKTESSDDENAVFTSKIEKILKGWEDVCGLSSKRQWKKFLHRKISHVNQSKRIFNVCTPK